MVRGRILKMSDGSVDLKEAARAEAYAMPLEDIHVHRAG